MRLYNVEIQPLFPKSFQQENL